MGEISSLLKQKFANELGTLDLYSQGGSEDLSNLRAKLPEGEIEEKWTKKYKDSIDCNNPKGFSQKAHCQGRKKKENKESTGASSAGGYSQPLFGDMKENEEYCDSCDRVKSKCICNDTKKIEATEATGAASSGQYSGPSIWAKSLNKKDWRGKKKTQIPGGKFVTIKKKCKTFPYCNQGDIKALKLYENETVKKVINKISKEHNISENVIKSIIQYEIEKQKNK